MSVNHLFSERTFLGKFDCFCFWMLQISLWAAGALSWSSFVAIGHDLCTKVTVNCTSIKGTS